MSAILKAVVVVILAASLISFFGWAFKILFGSFFQQLGYVFGLLVWTVTLWIIFKPLKKINTSYDKTGEQ